jgi:hypothetical protein
MALRGFKKGRYKGCTNMYAAPEYDSESKLIDFKADVYAFGMVGAAPFAFTIFYN